jgi:hypothetical protein
MSNPITHALDNLAPLTNAIDDFGALFTVSRGLGEQVGQVLTCSEANRFADLLDALGLSELAADLLSNHYHNGDTDDAGWENHWELVEVTQGEPNEWYLDERITPERAGWHDNNSPAADYDPSTDGGDNSAELRSTADYR